MKRRKVFIAFSIVLFCGSLNIYAQKIYTVSSGEMIFSRADVNLTDAYMQAYPLARIDYNPTRWTVFLHLGQYIHTDFSDNIGFFTGSSLRNVGYISDERLPRISNPTSIDDYQNYKVIRRTYNVGIPLALKIGSFSNHMYFFGGGEMEWAFVAKHKWWESHSRSGPKVKRLDWFPRDIYALQPSVFAGIQFPKGFNVKFRYYLTDYIRKENVSNDPLNVANLGRYQSPRLMYISLCWQFQHKWERSTSQSKEEQYNL